MLSGQGGGMQRVSSFIIPISIICLTILGFALNPQHTRAEIAAAILVDPVDGLITDENGRTDTFTIQLDSQPTSKVTITITSSILSEGQVSTETVPFTQGNWNNLKTITVTGIPDGIEDGDVLYEITGTATSDDPEFEGLVMPPVSVINLNDPVPIATDDFPPVDGYSPIIIPVLDNDSALNDVPIEITVISDPAFGTYTINPEPDSTITYTPSLDTFLGLDQFTYQICDLDADCASADVIIEDQIPPEIISITPVGIGDIYEVSDEEITIEVEVIDNFQVNCVEFIRWDAVGNQFIELGEDCEFPYQLILDTSTLNYAWNQIYILATDVAGNATSHFFIWLYRIMRTYIPLIISP